MRNVILIVADQWRADALGCAGHPVVRTPNLDLLAKQGVCFDRAYSATPTCIPARAALLTGLSQVRHGRVGYEEGIAWNYPVTLPRTFGQHGYQTQAIGKLHVHPPRNRVGFDHVILHDNTGYARKRHPDLARCDDYHAWLRAQLGRPEADILEHGINSNSHTARPWDKPEHVHPTNFVVTQAIEFLKRRDPTVPFFLFLSFVRPHPPFDPPGWAIEQYLEGYLPDPVIGDWEDALFGPHVEPWGDRAQFVRLPPQDQRRCQAAYYGCITQIDHQIGRFMDHLELEGLAQDSTICFTADHGESLGDHFLFHKTYPYEGSARVPLILKSPGLPGGQRCRDLAELRDIMPTLLECADLGVPTTLDGRSLLPAARGLPHEPRSWLHGEHPIRRSGLGQCVHWVTDDRFKYIWFSDGTEQLFDLVEDAEERHDLKLSDRHRARRERLRAALVEILRDRPEGYSDGIRLVPGRKAVNLLAPSENRLG
jgi:arylsulfatase